MMKLIARKGGKVVTGAPDPTFWVVDKPVPEAATVTLALRRAQASPRSGDVDRWLLNVGHARPKSGVAGEGVVVPDARLLHAAMLMRVL